MLTANLCNIANAHLTARGEKILNKRTAELCGNQNLM